jgi:hypothetical protein
MSFEADRVRDRQMAEYAALKEGTQRVLDEAQAWSERATKLHAAVADETKKAEVIVLRDELVAELRSIFSI